jgi:hypothetical protein
MPPTAAAAHQIPPGLRNFNVGGAWAAVTNPPGDSEQAGLLQISAAEWSGAATAGRPDTAKPVGARTELAVQVGQSAAELAVARSITSERGMAPGAEPGRFGRAAEAVIGFFGRSTRARRFGAVGAAAVALGAGGLTAGCAAGNVNVGSINCFTHAHFRVGGKQIVGLSETHCTSTDSLTVYKQDLVLSVRSQSQEKRHWIPIEFASSSVVPTANGPTLKVETPPIVCTPSSQDIKRVYRIKDTLDVVVAGHGGTFNIHKKSQFTAAECNQNPPRTK